MKRGEVYHALPMLMLVPIQLLSNLGLVFNSRCSFPTYPYENNIYGHFGNPPLEAFSCNISNYDRDGGVDGNAIDPSCELMDVVNENVKGKKQAGCSSTSDHSSVVNSVHIKYAVVSKCNASEGNRKYSAVAPAGNR